DPVAVPVSKVSPRAATERRPPIPQVSRVQSSDEEKQSFVLPSYVLPIMAGVVAVILLFSLPQLFRQKSDAAPAEVAAKSAPTGGPDEPKTAPHSETTTSTPQKGASAAPATTGTYHPPGPPP